MGNRASRIHVWRTRFTRSYTPILVSNIEWYLAGCSINYQFYNESWTVEGYEHLRFDITRYAFEFIESLYVELAMASEDIEDEHHCNTT